MNRLRTIAVLAALSSTMLLPAANADTSSSSNVRPIQIEIKPNPATGQTTEQDNIAERYKRDNLPGSLKHLYVIAPKSGVAILYSTVQGKVTSGGKRLTPRSTIEKYDCGKDCVHYEGQRVLIGGAEYVTTEIMQDDGTYGSSAPYLYWFDAQGRYHQHFFTDGQIIAIVDQPLANKRVIINADIAAGKR
ncbi:MAG: hypothetical protein IPK73_01320 [Candidatus Obscuribacter sp.]|nr:hypothetical protein [Candidatus Obscuribacter sp.]MBK9280359.1 hypothetical protein [Candidatus Obscuribacter sp.]